MLSLQSKKELILEVEQTFTRSIGRVLFEKPTVSFWMILIPFLLIYFIYRMKRYRNGRHRFQQEFMITRRKALDIAAEAVTFDIPPRIDEWVQRAGLAPEVTGPYRRWLTALVTYHRALLAADGEDFVGLVRSAFPHREKFLDAMQSLGAAEEAFHAALHPGARATADTAEIINIMEKRARGLRLELADAIYDGL